MSRKNPNRQGFMNTVDTIKNAENDVDKVLQAARLKRIEGGGNTGKVALAIAAIICLAAIVCMAIYMDFSSGIKGAGFISFIVGGGGIVGIALVVFMCCIKD